MGQFGAGTGGPLAGSALRQAVGRPVPQTRQVLLPTPGSEPDDAVTWVRVHLDDLCGDVPAASPAFRGGQAAADAALAALDLTGYAARRNTVLPYSRRGASRISPYVRHGLIDLPTAWDAAGTSRGPRR